MTNTFSQETIATKGKITCFLCCLDYMPELLEEDLHHREATLVRRLVHSSYW